MNNLPETVLARKVEQELATVGLSVSVDSPVSVFAVSVRTLQ